MALLALIAASHAASADPVDLAEAVACGQANLDQYNQDPANPRNDEVLAKAAACFQRGKSISAALQVDTMLIKSFPNSKYAALAIRDSGVMYEQIAMYDRAADKLEDYAKRYAGEKDAADLLTDAIRLRAALGDRAKQIADTKQWIRTFGAKRKADAAAAELSLVAVLDGDDAVAQLREFLKIYATVDPALTIAAHSQLADRLRAKSCPVRAIDGLCVRVVAVAAPHCGAESTSRVAVKRTADNREALVEYRAVIALADKPAEPNARHARAMAKLALADDDLETMLAAQFPHDLDLDRAEGKKRFRQWLDAELKLRTKLDNAYSDVLGEKDATSSVAAAARFGEVAQAFWRMLMLGEIPKPMRKAPEHDAYCDALKTVSDPFRARAIEAAGTCVAKSVELEAGQEWADVCWRDGAQLDPERFAPVSELHGTPSGFAAPIALEPAL